MQGRVTFGWGGPSCWSWTPAKPRLNAR